MRYKGVLLDIDNTLYDYDTAHKAALDAAAGHVSAQCGVGANALARAYMAARAQVGSELAGTAAAHNRLLYFQLAFEMLGLNPMKHALGTYEAYWGAFLDNMTLYPDALLFLGSVRDREVCLVTDLTAHIQHRKALRLGLQEYAGHIATSEEAGRDKPHPAIFALALKKTGLKADEVCMVGDSFEKDIAGAAAAGIDSFWMNRDGQAVRPGVRTTVVSSFTELMGQLS